MKPSMEAKCLVLLYHHSGNYKHKDQQDQAEWSQWWEEYKIKTPKFIGDKPNLKEMETPKKYIYN